MISCVVCTRCVDKRFGKNRWLMTADLGRFPPGFKHLGLLEQIIMARLIMFGHVNKMGCTITSTGTTSKVNKLFGHMLALPLSRLDILKSKCDELPRKEFVKYAARICFVGDGMAANAARKLTLQHGAYNIDIQKLKDWMKFMGQEEELERLTKHEAEYKESWAKELDELLEMTSLGDTETFSVLNTRASSDIGKMATQQEATGGFEHYILNPPAEPKKPTRQARLTWIKELVNGKDRDEGDAEGDDKVGDMKIKARISNTLMNEFEELDRIIYDGFHCNRSYQPRLIA